VASGASLAVTTEAYLAIGGLPPRAVGEDVALVEALNRAGFKVRHAMDVCVSTSCRFDGRARGGAADTMRHRHAVPDAPCDQNLEPALDATRRALCRRVLRVLWRAPGHELDVFLARLMVQPQSAASIQNGEPRGFADLWDRVSGESPVLARRQLLRPSDLPRQIAIAEMILRHLRARRPGAQTVPADTPRHGRWFAAATG
jgi:hypothetical protein